MGEVSELKPSLIRLLCKVFFFFFQKKEVPKLNAVKLTKSTQGSESLTPCTRPASYHRPSTAENNTNLPSMQCDPQAGGVPPREGPLVVRQHAQPSRLRTNTQQCQYIKSMTLMTIYHHPNNTFKFNPQLVATVCVCVRVREFERPMITPPQRRRRCQFLFPRHVRALMIIHTDHFRLLLFALLWRRDAYPRGSLTVTGIHFLKPI